jgi:hypothetical protein
VWISNAQPIQVGFRIWGTKIVTHLTDTVISVDSRRWWIGVTVGVAVTLEFAGPPLPLKYLKKNKKQTENVTWKTHEIQTKSEKY